MELERDGFTILRGLLSHEECAGFVDGVDAALRLQADGAIASSSGGVVGGRNLLSRWRDWCPILERDELKRLVRRVVGDQAGFVRMLYFDKPPGMATGGVSSIAAAIVVYLAVSKMSCRRDRWSFVCVHI